MNDHELATAAAEQHARPVASRSLRRAGRAALVGAGGTVHHFGMPVDPGNLLMLGQFGQAPVIGTPVPLPKTAAPVAGKTASAA